MSLLKRSQRLGLSKTAMGTCLAPTLTCFWASFILLLRDLVFDCILSIISSFSSLMFPIPSPSSLNTSMVIIPSNSFSTSSTQVTFLDVDVCLGHGHFLIFVHAKAINLQQYLYFSSCHPSSSSVPFHFSLVIQRW